MQHANRDEKRSTIAKENPHKDSIFDRNERTSLHVVVGSSYTGVLVRANKCTSPSRLRIDCPRLRLHHHHHYHHLKPFLSRSFVFCFSEPKIRVERARITHAICTSQTTSIRSTNRLANEIDFNRHFIVFFGRPNPSPSQMPNARRHFCFVFFRCQKHPSPKRSRLMTFKRRPNVSSTMKTESECKVKSADELFKVIE